MKILAFGICREIFATSELNIENENISDVASLKDYLSQSYPALANLKSYMIAVNNEYVSDNQSISINDEIAIIPPVSGG